MNFWYLKLMIIPIIENYISIVIYFKLKKFGINKTKEFLKY